MTKETVNLSIEERIERCNAIRKELVGYTNMIDPKKYTNREEEHYWHHLTSERNKLVNELNAHHRILNVSLINGNEKELSNIKEDEFSKK